MTTTSLSPDSLWFLSNTKKKLTWPLCGRVEEQARAVSIEAATAQIACLVQPRPEVRLIVCGNGSANFTVP